MQNNRFYSLPLEIQNKIYLLDPTFSNQMNIVLQEMNCWFRLGCRRFQKEMIKLPHHLTSWTILSRTQHIFKILNKNKSRLYKVIIPFYYPFESPKVYWKKDWKSWTLLPPLDWAPICNMSNLLLSYDFYPNETLEEKNKC